MRKLIFSLCLVSLFAIGIIPAAAAQTSTTTTATPAPTTATTATSQPATTATPIPATTATPNPTTITKPTTTTAVITRPSTQNQTIAEVFTEDAANKKTPQFTTLLTALKDANLMGVLNGPGPFTIFAPTDAAFSHLPTGLSTAGLIGNPSMLNNVLRYHLLNGKVAASQLSKITSLTALSGLALSVADRAGSIFLNNDAQIATTDIQAKNGIIHIINNVLVPPYTTPTDSLAVVTSNQPVYGTPNSSFMGGTVATCQTFFVSQYDQGFFQLPQIDGWVDARALSFVPANYGQVGGAPKAAGC